MAMRCLNRTLAHETLVAGWSAVRALGADVALFRKTRGDSNVGALLAVQAIGCEHAEAPFAQFRGKTDFAMVLSRRSPKAQSSRRRLLRRLQETGDISFETGADPQSAQSLLRAAFKMKRDWLLRGAFIRRRSKATPCWLSSSISRRARQIR